MANTSSSSSGIGLLSVLGVVFVVLKLTKVISWSWWWVTLPFWAGLLCCYCFLVVSSMVFALSIISVNPYNNRIHSDRQDWLAEEN